MNQNAIRKPNRKFQVVDGKKELEFYAEREELGYTVNYFYR